MIAVATYRSVFSFEAEKPSSGQSAEVFLVLPNSILTEVEMPPLSTKQADMWKHRVRFQYKGARCTATPRQFLEVGSCYELP